jgi:hypothetical protein
MKRKIVQIAGSDNRIYALDDDGTLWEMNFDGVWVEHPPLPDKDVPAYTTIGELFLGERTKAT